MATIQFMTGDYQRKHLQDPKGWGDWEFEVPGLSVVAAPRGVTYEEAKRWLTQQLIPALPRGDATIFVAVRP